MVKKILWLCNTMLPELFSRFDTFNVKEGWLVGISNGLRQQKDIELHYVCPQMQKKRIVNIEKNGIQFHCFYVKYDNLYTVCEEVREQIGKIIRAVKPDIIHIFGTEMPHAAACVDCCADRKETLIVSIQGLVSEYAKYYLDGIPRRAYLKGVIVNKKYQSILNQYKEFCKRSDNEISVIKHVEQVIGRTDWDRVCVERINRSCKYHYCSETLRDCFYNKMWEIDKVQKYSIFVSQGNYPIKGLHNLLEVLPEIVERYPKTKVYVSGSNTFLNDGSPYGVYIKNIIRKKSLGSHIFFLGELNEEKVCRQLLKTHVAVMPSNIENSPNSIGEAMLVGVPVVAAFVGGIPSILCHGREGFLYQPNSVGMLLYYICQIFGNESLAERLSLNGRMRAEKLYDREHNLQRLLSIYNDVC